MGRGDGENPRAARFGAVEMLWAGEMARVRREEAFARFVSLVDAGREVAEEPDSIPPHRAPAVIGSITDMFTKRLGQLAALLGALAEHPEMARFFLVAPPAAGDALADRHHEALRELVGELTAGAPALRGGGELSPAGASRRSPAASRAW